jgi:hypothetical protein
MMDDRLHLSLLRQPGSDARTTLVLAENTLLEVSGKNVTVQGHPLSEGEWKMLSQAKITFQKDVTTLPALWQISSFRGNLVCAVNDARLTQGKQASLQLGDRIEIGLLRFEVVPAAGGASFSHREVGPEENLENETFDLGTLAGTSGWKAPGSEENPFDLVGVRVSSLDAPLVSDSVDSSVIAAPVSEADFSIIPPEENADILARLANEYVKVILDPDHLHRQYGGEIAPDRVDLTVSSPEELHQGWDKNQSLEDIVSGKLTMKGILNNLGIDEFQNLEITPRSPADEVLSLFAQGVLSGGKKRGERIPARTRNDHHRVSLDSPYQPEETSGNILSGIHADEKGR